MVLTVTYEMLQRYTCGALSMQTKSLASGLLLMQAKDYHKPWQIFYTKHTLREKT